MVRIAVPAGAGTATDLLHIDGGYHGRSAFYVATSEGCLLRYTAASPSEPFLVEKQWWPASQAIRRIAVLPPPEDGGEGNGGKGKEDRLPAADRLILATCDGPLLLLRTADGCATRLTCTADGKAVKMGPVTAIAAGADGAVYIGEESGDVHACTLVGGPAACAAERLEVGSTYDFHDDYVASLVAVPPKKVLIAASGDGKISVMDLKKQRLLAASANCDEDFNCLLLMPSAAWLVAGSSAGRLSLFRWNRWGAPASCLSSKHHANEGVNDIVLIDEQHSIVATVTDDGAIRLVGTAPLSAGTKIFNGRQALERAIYIPTAAAYGGGGGNVDGNGDLPAQGDDEPAQDDDKRVIGTLIVMGAHDIDINAIAVTSGMVREAAGRGNRRPAKERKAAAPLSVEKEDEDGPSDGPSDASAGSSSSADDSDDSDARQQPGKRPKAAAPPKDSFFSSLD